MKIKTLFIILTVCFSSLLMSCRDGTPEPHHITFKNSSKSEIQIIRTLYTEFNPYISLKSGNEISKDVEYEGGGFTFYFFFNNQKYCASIYPGHSRWFSLVFSENENSKIKCTYQWESWVKTYSEDMCIEEVLE